jgi:hydrogenase/urease accessory protein HupE
LLPLLVYAAAASAHRLSPAYFGLTETEPGVFAAQWKVSVSGGLADALEPQIPSGCAVDGRVRSFVVDDARVQHATLRCDGPMEGREFRVDGLSRTDTDVLLRVDYLDGSSYTHRLLPDAASVLIPEKPGYLDVALTYLVLGVEHILFGIDHLLFVLALLLLVSGWRRLVATITAFTLAHSITLAAATLGFVHVPSAPVEATIALSILFLATELARRDTREFSAETADSLALRFPWVVAFSFGLLHGFGFAGALAEVGLPEQAIPLALLFFNVGVEIGQLLFVAAVLALSFGFDKLRLSMPAWSARATAYVIGSIAAFWVFERTVTAI